MCFVLDRDNYRPEPKLAIRDIICYKVARAEWTPFFLFKPYYRSKYTYLLWRRPRKVKLFIDNHNDGYYINKGYHAFKGEEYTRVVAGKYVAMGEFKIPKGTWYYENNRGYVAEQMVYLGRIDRR